MNYCAFSNGMRMIIFDRDYIFNTYDKTNKFHPMFNGIPKSLNS